MKCFMTNQECIHELEIRKTRDKPGEDKRSPNGIFIASPFGYPYDDLYTKVIKSLKTRTVRRADRAVQLGFVMCQKVCREMRIAEYVMVDITEENPNVYYELGLAFGFGRKIIFVNGEPDRAQQGAAAAWSRFLREHSTEYITYENLRPLYGGSDSSPEAVANVLGLLEKRALSSDTLTKDLRDPYSYLSGVEDQRGPKHILFCLDTPLADRAMLIDTAQQVLSDQGGGWKLRQLEMNTGFAVGELIQELRECKACMVDISHYQGRVNPNSYWALGLAHALGRDTVPITNRSRSGGSTPFDVLGLYQIYFEDLERFGASFSDILGAIDKHYKDQIKEYPRRYIWDQILGPNPELEFCTFGRGSSDDPIREAGRTNVDTWDYQAVARLAAFLAQQYKETKFDIDPPENKRAGKGRAEIAARKREVEMKLRTNKNFIIIGSPDVSDYAEIVLASGYQIQPYVPIPCENATCLTNCPKACVGRRGYIFYKRRFFTSKRPHTEGGANHPRACSFCYRDAVDASKERVLWYGTAHECTKTATYGVITVFYRNPIGGDANSVIVLSGFTGIATFGLARLLAGEGDDAKATGKLQRQLRRFRKEEEAVQILVKITYSRPENRGIHRDARSLQAIDVVDVQPMQKAGKTAPSVSLGQTGRAPAYLGSAL